MGQDVAQAVGRRRCFGRQIDGWAEQAEQAGRGQVLYHVDGKRTLRNVQGAAGTAQPCGKTQVVPDQKQEHHRCSCAPQDRQDPGDSGEKGVIGITVLLQDRAAIVIIKAESSQSGEAETGDTGAHDRGLSLSFPDMLNITLRHICVAGGEGVYRGVLHLRRKVHCPQGGQEGELNGDQQPDQHHQPQSIAVHRGQPVPGEPPYSQYRQDQQN